MTRIRPQQRLRAPVLLALLVLTAGCADPSSDPRAAGSAPSSPAASAKGFCPPPEDTLASPSPCISYGWDQRVAENHAYREAQPITAGQRQEAQPRATALAAALQELAAKGTTPDGLRTAAAEALGLQTRQIEVEGGVRVPPPDLLGWGGVGRGGVKGPLGNTGAPTAGGVGR
ncbi:precorrin-3B C(17)-methyltransferase, partial [Streptomyces sp. NPDC059755]|uniref:precorrin-3B C(17)-methyltransferase n=1 Tax=Streptomyces sp. NPDC059755 TaxID=3346934 RepID=UPI00366935C4